jgi:hypothetical protein
MEDDDVLVKPIGFAGLLDTIGGLDPFQKADTCNILVAFIDKIYHATTTIFDQHVEPRGFASPVEERAAAIALSIFLNVTKGLDDGMESATQMYLDILDEVQQDAVYAYDILVKKSTNPATMDGQLFPCETDPDPALGTTRDPNPGPGIKRRPTRGE